MVHAYHIGMPFTAMVHAKFTHVQVLFSLAQIHLQDAYNRNILDLYLR